jgi:hypothetical protein
VARLVASDIRFPVASDLNCYPRVDIAYLRRRHAQHEPAGSFYNRGGSNEVIGDVTGYWLSGSASTSPRSPSPTRGPSTPAPEAAIDPDPSVQVSPCW